MSDFTVLDIETTGSDPWRHKLVAVGLGNRVFRPEEAHLAFDAIRLGRGIVVAHTNYDLRWLLLAGGKLGDDIQFHDTKVMAWLDDAAQELSLAALSKKYLGYEPPKPIRMVGGRVMFDLSVWNPQTAHALHDETVVPIEDVPWSVMEGYNMSDLTAEAALYVELRDRLRRKGLWGMFLKEEAPFSRLLVEMEATGMPFDAARASEILAETSARLETLRKTLVRETGAIDFNPGSGDQVARHLYTELWEQPVKFSIPRLNGLPPEEKLRKVQAIAPKGVKVDRVGREYAYGVQRLYGRGLPVPKEKHPGHRPTVSSKVLDILYGDDPWVAKYVEWRKLDKLRGYLVDWIDRCHDGRLHGRFDQSGTITGRLSAREPNLQQVSKESEVRGLFVGDLVIGDYAGLEARLAAHFSQDPVMLDIFRSGKDLYGVLAARAWGGPDSKENSKRDTMKVVWLASQYGAKGETLAHAMAINGIRGVTPEQADEMLRDMQRTVPRLFAWRDEVIAQARVDRYVTTIGGRQRHLSDIDSPYWMTAYKAERQAVNSLVQGSAADVVRRAMLVCRKTIPLAVARICLQVHDEILFIRGPEWEDSWLLPILQACEVEYGFDLTVPLVFEAKIAQSWGEKA